MIAKTFQILGFLFVVLILLPIAVVIVFGKTIEEDYEARLTPRNFITQEASGKVEWQRYADGEIVLLVVVRGLDSHVDKQVDMVLNGNGIGSFAVEAAYTKHSLSTKSGDVFPKVKPDDLFEIRYAGKTLLLGEFYPD